MKLDTVVIETTRACNLNCLHCGSNCNRQPASDELSAGDWIGIFRQFADLGVKKVVFSGGEPFLKKDFDLMIREISGFGFKFGIISNGLKVSDRFIELLSEIKPFAVGVSIDGLAATHNLIRGNTQAWLKSLSSIVKLQAAGIPVSVVTTISKYNFLELPAIFSLLDCLGVKAWQVQMASPMGRLSGANDQIIDSGEFNSVCQCLRKMILEQSSGPRVFLADCFGYGALDPAIPRNFPGCQAGLSVLGIKSNGDVLPCLSLYFDEFIAGSLKAESLEAIWNSDRSFAFNRQFDLDSIPPESKCYLCDKRNACRGGCSSLSYACYGRLHSQPFCIEHDFQQIEEDS